MPKKIVVDVDDVLWGLNEKICSERGIDYSKIVTFSSSANPLLSESEKKELKESYGDAKIFRNIKWYEGVSELFSLEGYGATVIINSNNLCKEVMDTKEAEIRNNFPSIRDEQLVLNVPNNYSEKSIGDDVFILVDDSPYNVAKCNAEYYLVPRKPWNMSEDGTSIMKDKLNSVIFYDNFIEALEIMKRLSACSM